MTRNGRVPIYPAVLALAMLLAFVLPSGASPYAAIRLIVGFVVGALLVSAVARLLLGDGNRAGVAATLVVLFAFAGFDWRLALLLLTGLALVVAERLVARRRPSRVPWALAGRAMNAVAVIVLVAVAIRSAGDGSLGSFVGAIRSEAPVWLRGQSPVSTASPAGGEAPDVFLFLLDGHARADKLRDIFGYDDGPFLSALTDRGFEVAPASRSNYLITAQSLPSMLNMAHIADLMDRQVAAASSAGYENQIRALASHPRVFDVFHSLGYEVVAIASGFEEVALRGADRFIDTGQINELETRILGNTVVAPAIQLVAPDWFADQHRSRVVSVLEEAAAVARETHGRPRLVLVHVPSPHAPIVFAADGTAVPMTDLANFFDDTFVRRPIPRPAALAQYAGQVAHVDDLAIAAVDAVLATPGPRPIVLVLSDHGSAAGVRWDDLVGSDLDERTATLFAAYTPDVPGVFPPNITLVNVFGLLLQAYFGRDYEMQPNTSYRWESHLINLVPIDLPEESVAK